MKTIDQVISRIEEAFKRDDVRTIGRAELAVLITNVYDDLNEIRGTMPDWWERDELAEEKLLREIVCS